MLHYYFQFLKERHCILEKQPFALVSMVFACLECVWGWSKICYIMSTLPQYPEAFLMNQDKGCVEVQV